MDIYNSSGSLLNESQINLSKDIINLPMVVVDRISLLYKYLLHFISIKLIINYKEIGNNNTTSYIK